MRIVSRSTFMPSIRGRLGRINYVALLTFWTYVAIVPVFIVGIAELCDIHLHITSHSDLPEIIRLTIFLLPTFIYAAISIAAIIIRRLHDMNLRGWWLFAAILLDTAFFQFASQYIYHMPQVILYLPIILIGVVSVIPGTSSVNRFGCVTDSVGRLSSFFVFCSAVVLCVVLLPLLYFVLWILIMSQSHWSC